MVAAGCPLVAAGQVSGVEFGGTSEGPEGGVGKASNGVAGTKVYMCMGKSQTNSYSDSKISMHQFQSLYGLKKHGRFQIILNINQIKKP